MMSRAFLSLLLVAVLGSAATARIWTDVNGRQIDAEFRGIHNGMVVLETRDGRLHPIKPDLLNISDQEYIKQLVAQQAQPQAGAEGPAAADVGGPSGTAARFDEAIQANPNDPKAWYQRGVARSLRGDHSGAVKDLDRAIQLDPKMAEAYDARGAAYRGLGRPVEAHRDFNKAIELNPELASAYKNRGENLTAFSRTPEGKVELNEEIEKFRKKYHSAAGNNMRNTPWQPLNNTTGNVSRSAGIMQLARLDLERARELEAVRGGGEHYGVGYGVGYGGGPGYGPGPGPGPGPAVGPGPIVTEPALQVLPYEVKRGDTITLVANPAALAKGLVHKVGPDQPFPVEDYVGFYAKPYNPSGRLRLRANVPTAQDIEQVDFYRDVDGDNKLNRDVDELVGTDANPSDGFWIEVPTSAFPPGNHTFFAVPRGGECPCSGGGSGSGGMTAEELLRLVRNLERAAQTEADLAEAARSAAEGEGLEAEQAAGLGRNNNLAASVARNVAEKVQNAHPLVSKMLSDAQQPLEQVNAQLAKAEQEPGEPSKPLASETADQAEKLAELFREAAELLKSAAEDPQFVERMMQEAGQGESEPAPPQLAAGIPAAAAARINPAPGEAAPAPGPGPGPGTGPGAPACDDDHYVYDDRADHAIRDALAFVDDGDYDHAVEVYDRLVEDYPDRWHFVRDRADLYLHTGGYDYAVRDYGRLIETVGATADLYYNRGCAYLAANRFAEALADFTKSIELNETWNLAWNNRGTTYARMGEYQKAIADFERAIELNPNDHLAYRNRALAYKRLGQEDKAVADMNRAKELEQLAAEQPPVNEAQ